MQETWVQSLGQEDLLEEEMATHYSILAWRIPWIEETGGLQSMVSHRVGHYWATFTFNKDPRMVDMHQVQNEIPRMEQVQNIESNIFDSIFLPLRKEPMDIYLHLQNHVKGY